MKLTVDMGELLFEVVAEARGQGHAASTGTTRDSASGIARRRPASSPIRHNTRAAERLDVARARELADAFGEAADVLEAGGKVTPRMLELIASTWEHLYGVDHARRVRMVFIEAVEDASRIAIPAGWRTDDETMLRAQYAKAYFRRSVPLLGHLVDPAKVAELLRVWHQDAGRHPESKWRLVSKLCAALGIRAAKPKQLMDDWGLWQATGGEGWKQNK